MNRASINRDIFLFKAAKLTKYANYQKICDGFFAIFTVLWIVTRLGFFPRIIYSMSFDGPRVVEIFPAFYIFLALLMMLLVLHIAWTYLILKIAYIALNCGQMDGDLRSSSEISDSSELSQPQQRAVTTSTNGTPKKSKQSSANNSPKLIKTKKTEGGEKQS